jgi:hypothetical protein
MGVPVMAAHGPDQDRLLSTTAERAALFVSLTKNKPKIFRIAALTMLGADVPGIKRGGGGSCDHGNMTARRVFKSAHDSRKILLLGRINTLLSLSS